jgi:hypothetical protein
MFEMGPPGAACHSPNEIPPECVVTLAGFREPSCTGSGTIVGGLHLGNAGTKRFIIEYPARRAHKTCDSDTLLEGKSITCRFKHVMVPVCWLGTAMSHTCYSAKAGQASPTEGQNRIRAALNLRLAAGLALLGLVLACASSPARAQQWTPQQRAACEPDAMRLCNQYVPDVQRVLVRPAAQFSRAARRRG